ncbi:atherin-like isoform X1 [Amphibalanus amphitrite]|uniref:atherin-like isoform X1 n=1 Tax=Amphibalanus amphitrite TaxID=1232801 RepID=UPI001C903189|nr:atherin-like isoform X1 [Amphibalanus amphitrite]
MDNAIYHFMDCDGSKDGPPQPYPDLSQIADFSTAAEAAPQDEPAQPRVRKFYPGVLDSKYMQAVVRGGREGLLQFRENPQRSHPVPYPWPEWFDHETGSPAGKKRHGQRGYPEGCTSQRPAAVPGCGGSVSGGGGGNRPVPSMYDPPPCAAAVAAANAAASAAAAQHCQPVVVACPIPAQQAQPHHQQHQHQPQQPPPFVRAANTEHCIPCSAAPEVWADPSDPRADCTPHRPPPPQHHAPHQQRPRPQPASTDRNFVPSYLHEPENMAKIIAHDYQRQWVDERDSWEESHATSNDNQRMRMQNRCSHQERKFVEHQKCARDTKAKVAEGQLPDCRKKSTTRRPWYPPGKVCVVRRRCGC